MKVLKFYADWCQPCKSLSNVINNMDVSVIDVTSINIETDMDLALEYKVRNVPTCVLVEDDGKEVRRKVGMMTESEFKQFVGE